MYNQSEYDILTPEQREELEELVNTAEDRLLSILTVFAYPALGLVLFYIIKLLSLLS